MNLKLPQALRTQTIKDTFISFSGQFGASIQGLVFFVLTFRFLGDYNFGIFSLAYATSVIIKDFIDPAVNSALLRFIPGYPSQAGAYIKYAFIFKLIYFLIVTPILLLIARPFSLLVFKHLYLGLIPLVLTTAAGLSFASLISGIFRARKQFLIDSVYTFFQPFLRLILLGLIFITGQISVQSILVINLTAYLLCSVVAFYYLTPSFFRSHITSSHRRAVNTFLPPMILAGTTGTITDRLNLYITNFYLGLSPVGIFSALTRLFTPVPQLAGVLDGVLGTRFAGFPDSVQANRYLIKALALTLLLSAGLLSSNLFILPILNLFGPSVASQTQLFTHLTLAYSIFLIQVPLVSHLIYFKGRSDLMLVIAFVQLFGTIVYNALLIPRLGLTGAALSLVLVFTSSTLTAGLCLFTKSKSQSLHP